MYTFNGFPSKKLYTWTITPNFYAGLYETCALVDNWTRTLSEISRVEMQTLLSLVSATVCRPFSKPQKIQHAQWIACAIFVRLSCLIDNTQRAVNGCDLFLNLDQNCARLRIPHRHRAVSQPEVFNSGAFIVLIICCHICYVNNTCNSRDILKDLWRQNQGHDCRYYRQLG